MSDTTQHSCLECDILLMRLFGNPDLASLHDESQTAARDVLKDTHACSECGTVLARQDSGVLVETRTKSNGVATGTNDLADWC